MIDLIRKLDSVLWSDLYSRILLLSLPGSAESTEGKVGSLQHEHLT